MTQHDGEALWIPRERVNRVARRAVTTGDAGQDASKDSDPRRAATQDAECRHRAHQKVLIGWGVYCVPLPRKRSRTSRERASAATLRALLQRGAAVLGQAQLLLLDGLPRLQREELVGRLRRLQDADRALALLDQGGKEF